MPLLFSAADINRTFTGSYLTRGREYYRAGKVASLDVQQDGTLIGAVVAGSGGSRYRVLIRVQPLPNGSAQIAGQCACPVGYNCKHVAAVLLKALAERPLQDSPAVSPGAPAEPALPPEIALWLSAIERVGQSQDARDAVPPDTPQRILYVLDLAGTAPARLSVGFFTARLLKAGGYGKATPYHNVSNVLYGSAPRFVSELDREIIAGLNLQTAITGGATRGLSGSRGAQLLGQMVAAGRCFWKTPASAPLHLGETRTAHPSWTTDERGNQRLDFETTPPVRVLPLAPPWYLDDEAGQCGPLDTGLPDEVAGALASAPVIPPRLAGRVSQALAGRLPGVQAPLPRTLREKEVSGVRPAPCLRLTSLQLPPAYHYGGYRRYHDPDDDYPEFLDLARLEFDYDGARIDAWSPDKVVTRTSADELLRIARDDAAERALAAVIAEQGFFPAAVFELPNLPRQHWDSLTLEGDDDWIDFCLSDLPQLQADGWRVEMDESFRFRFAEVEDWSATVDEGGGNDWFGLELGIQVEGERINLLPILVNLIRQAPQEMSAQALAQLSDEDGRFLGRLADGRLVPLPISRVRGILSVLVELFDTDAIGGTERLELPLIHAARLAELEAAAGLRWLGGERLRELGQKLRDFQGVQPVEPPAGLKAELRPYQREGLNWLQFLREYGLGGILADDMGLGKTVQTLAHLLIEKHSGRMDRPCLVVAPTSLMFNWRREAERFAPDLRVLVLQGLGRKQHFDAIGDYDLVLTTYPLLSRDKEVLMAREFHFLILDEAHIIKNPKALATQIVHQIKARHRLALTGTPMENHLGELWSLFHFLVPGLLGDAQAFRKLFRTPIEKQGDGDRRATLSRRIAPFLLRRSKDQVAGELPPKTEIMRSCELAGPQRDLYETIRVAMHEKVRQEIDKKGVNRSQIVILDALLKLRQVCCDPRLLKLPAAARVRQSAKLELLMSLLPEMVEEGRRILLFSQFTSMLELIEEELAKHGLRYVKLTGKTRDRASPVEQFQNGEVPLFLISLKAGGVGLNLTAADTVIHYDPWWNPAVENQATDRAHRIGQENPVFVYRLISEGTVEEKIVALQAKKRDLAAAVLGGEGEAGAALTAQDLEALFEPLG